MSHHHHDEDTEMVNAHNGETRISRRHSHTHLHLKPTMVFDHIKTKVKRKRASHNNLIEIPAFASNNHFNGNNIPKRTSQENNELELKKTLVVNRTQPVNLLGQSSDDSRENKKIELHSMFSKRIFQTFNLCFRFSD